MESMYIYAVRERSKWVGIAGWTGGKETCLAIAEDCFSHYGLTRSDGLVYWKSTLENQKNYKGRSVKFQLFTDSPEEVQIYANRRRALDYFQMWDGDVEKMRERVPELVPFLP